jgi:GTPase Era involved in 16S rRNA processing
LSGRPNTGKTTALNLLYKKITGKEPDDFNSEHIVKHKGKKIAIVLDGDVYQWCIRSIIKYANCDVLVLAYSDKFSRSLKKIVSEFKEYHHVVNKRCISDSDNERVCTEIMKKI